MTLTRLTARLVLANLLLGMFTLTAQKGPRAPVYVPPPANNNRRPASIGGSSTTTSGAGARPAISGPRTAGGGAATVRIGSNGNPVTVRGTNRGAPTSSVRTKPSASGNRTPQVTGVNSARIGPPKLVSNTNIPKLSAVQQTAARNRLGLLRTKTTVVSRSAGIRGVPKPAVGLPGKTVHVRSIDGLSGVNDNNRNYRTPTSFAGLNTLEVQKYVPDGWIMSKTAGEGGVRFRNPAIKGEQIRIMPGNPLSSGPDHRFPYVKVSFRGQKWHIPLKGNPYPSKREK